MTIKTYIRDVLVSLFNRRGYEIIEENMLYDWQKNPQTQPSYRQSPLPQDAKNYLDKNNSRLKELQDRYANLNSEVTIPWSWTENHVSHSDMVYFRGDNAYVWQLRGTNMNVMAYALTMYYVRSIDELGLLNTLQEDDFFGNYTFSIDSKLVSRDLLDSIMEIYFLEKHLNISESQGWTMLDIGAGYGRLAHRTVNALPNIAEYLCTDAFPVSTFISEYYLQFRNLNGRAKIVPLDEIEQTLRQKSVSIAVNIHSFSECRIPAIHWWLTRLKEQRVPYLMIVPNAVNHGGELLLTEDGKDMGEVIEKNGYKLRAKEPKFRDPIVQKYGVNPTFHYLFELQ